jgi:hypothetical protein
MTVVAATAAVSPMPATPGAAAGPDAIATLTDPYVQFQRLITGSAFRLGDLEDACAHDQLTPPQVELALVRMVNEEMRALIAQAQVLDQAEKVPMTPGLRAALAEMAEHAMHIDAQIADLERQRQLDKLTDRQRRAALTRATTAHTRLLKANVLLEVRLARQEERAERAGGEALGSYRQETRAAGTALVARTQQLAETLLATEDHITVPANPAAETVPCPGPSGPGSSPGDHARNGHAGHAQPAPASATPIANGHADPPAFLPWIPSASANNSAAPQVLGTTPLAVSKSASTSDPAVMAAVMKSARASLTPQSSRKKVEQRKQKEKARPKPHHKRH